MSYTNNGNGTVTDNNTGLMWQRQDDGNTYNWYQAVGEVNSSCNPSGSSYKNVCGSLTLGGYTDWRLPSKKELITIVGAEAEGDATVWDMDFTGPIALVVGSEAEGMRRTVKEHCDHIIKLPMQGKVNSLNASVATGVIIFEIMRQRLQKK